MTPFAAGKDAPAGDSDSDADSITKSGSPDNFEELNSQTQRVLRGDLAPAVCSNICRILQQTLQTQLTP